MHVPIISNFVKNLIKEAEGATDNQNLLSSPKNKNKSEITGEENKNQSS